ncbi:hypothetical protein SAMN04489844_0856 [Nocardioides exalbidus]|uniref:Uncharacterized protein n=1 Tax=Nocardioides exalbidus TaxID=402596 RepID=A0A1H4LEI1_9ACTN|nr:hypothetical protein [Nocardioides exalbidus]SEB69139.1 hypothetical protein SAMN04489844_0856 [Nocardioides exalbidus]
MPQSSDLEFVQGGAAERAVADDPFWSTVLRRHGDIDVVVLPQEPAVEQVVPADEPEVDPDQARAALRGQAAAFWSELGLDAEPTHVDDVWFAGVAPGTLRWQGTATFEQVDPLLASAALERAERILAADDGWHTLVPTDGLPRVIAGRAAQPGREEVHVVLASSTRLVVRMRSALVHVGAVAAAASLGGDVR